MKTWQCVRPEVVAVVLAQPDLLLGLEVLCLGDPAA